MTAKAGNEISIYAPNAKERTVIKTWNGNTTLQTKDGNNELILQTTETNQQNGIHRAIDSFYGSLVSLKADNGLNKIHIGDAQNFSNVKGIVSKVEGIFSNNAATSMEAKIGNQISIYAPNVKDRTIIKTWYKNAKTTLQTDTGNNELILQTTSTSSSGGIHRAIDVYSCGSVLLQANNGQNKIQIGDAKNFPDVDGVVSVVDGIFSNDAAMVMKAEKGNEISIYAPNA